MKILALQGVANSGKTTRIKEFLEEFRKRGANEVSKIGCGSQDIALLLNYRGCLVGVTSLGDSDKELKRLFSQASKCDLCICACRTHGGTVALIRENAGLDDCIILPKWKEDDSQRNQHTVQLLLSITDWLIDRYYYCGKKGI